MAKNVIIKTGEQVRMSHPIIIKALDVAQKNDVEIPLVYQYIQVQGEHIYPTPENTIGKISKIRVGFGGAYIGTVELFGDAQNVDQFNGRIDNFAVSVDPKTNKANIDAFIIYNLEKKAEIRKARLLKQQNIPPNSFLLKQGQIPFMESSPEKQDFIKQVSKVLIDEFNKNPTLNQQPIKEETSIKEADKNVGNADECEPL